MRTFRRLAVAVVAAATLTGGLAACSSGTSSDSSSGSSAQAESGSLPVTITHKFGETVVKEVPKRVVSLGYSDQDALLALGVTPVSVRSWDTITEAGNVAGPWAEDKVSGDKPEIYKADKVEPEAIAAMNPDLIVAIYSGIDKATYDALSKIAPVIAQEGAYEDYQQPWDVSTIQTGKAVGKPAEAEKLVAGVKEKVSALAARNPGWKGKSVTVATYDGSQLASFSSKDNRTTFFTNLGFVANPAVDATAKGKFYASFSLEEARQLNADLIVWDQLAYAPEGKATLDKQPVITALPAVAEKRSLYLEGELEKAFGWQTVLSLNYVLDNIEKPLKAVTEAAR